MEKNSEVKAARKQSGKTQAQVAKEVLINIRLYQKHETGVPNAKVGNRIANSELHPKNSGDTELQSYSTADLA